MITFLINQVALAAFNLINSRVDAYRIMKDKTIAHGINFGAYILFALVLYYFTTKPELTWAKFTYLDLLNFCLSAFFNRQFSFDIPLNLRRGLKWFYQSTAEKPKALLDRIERAIFGTGEDVGKKIFKVYSICYCLTIVGAWIQTMI